MGYSDSGTKMRTLLLIFAFYAAVYTVSGGQNIAYRREDVKVKESKDHECISDCSADLVTCTIEECGATENSTTITDPGFDIEDVHLERFKDPADEIYKLSLYLGWKPNENGLLNSTKGYMIEISDGKTKYKKCYNFASFLTDSQSQAVLYNDCFGRTKGTYILPFTTITADITRLPLNKNRPEGKVTITLEVPECTNSELHKLDECDAKRICAANCNTFSTDEDNVPHPILCTISEKEFGQGPEDCVPVNKTTSGNPSGPRFKDRRGYYKFTDPQTNRVEVALNFSWTPSPDASVKSLVGYTITVTPMGENDLTNFNKCFSIHTELTEKEHTNAEFFYDCYGIQSPTIGKVLPGKTYQVSVFSRPGSAPAHLKIKLPTCGDPYFADTTYCEVENNRSLGGVVEDIFCENRTVKYRYFVSSEFGDRAEVRFCEKGLLGCGHSLIFSPDLDLSGTLYNFSLSSAANLSINYSIIVSGSEHTHIRNFTYPNFSVCLKPSIVPILTIVLCVLIVTLVILITAFLVWFKFFKHKFSFCGLLKRYRDVYLSVGQPYPADFAPPVKVPGKTSIYVAFAEDHQLHKDSVHWLCTFLKVELGLDVRTSIWDDHEASTNRVKYVMANVKEADKVVIICSEGASDRSVDHGAGIKDNNIDMLLPVVTHAVHDLSRRNNPEKYVVAYFGYSKVEHIPEVLHEQHKLYSKAYKLMDDFEEFYFKLVGVEKYQEGGILRINEINSYSDPNTRSDCGTKLYEAIEKMSAYTIAYPTWYNDIHGEGAACQTTSSDHQLSQNGPQALSPAQVTTRLYTDGQPSINHFYPSPPMATSMGNGGARPKVRNGPQNPQYANDIAVRNHQNPPIQQYQNGMLPMQVIQPVQNQPPRVDWYPPGNTVELSSSRRQPSEHAEANRQPQEHSTMPDSTDISFEIPETDISSLSSSTAPSKPEDPKIPNPVVAQQPLVHSTGYNPSFHADSFTTADFPMSNDFNYGKDSYLMTNLPSNTTQMTSLGPGNSMPSPEKQEQNKLIEELLSPAQVPSTEDSPESGLFTLANLDEDEADLEDQIKSINISSTFETDL